MRLPTRSPLCYDAVPAFVPAAKPSMEFSPEMQKALLAQAQRDGSLSGLISPLVALEFGVVPVLWRDDVVLLACFPELDPRTFPALRTIVKHEVHGISFDRPILERALFALQRDTGGINFPTFRTPEFLAKSTAHADLALEKVEQGVEPYCRLPRTHVVCVDLRFRSFARNLDRDDAAHYRRLGKIETPFSARGGRVVCHDRSATREPTVLVGRRQFEYDGFELGNGIDGAILDEPPYLIHPSELQIYGIESDGTIALHIYDRTVLVAPGETARETCEYYYLSEGDRIHRRLDLEVTGVWRKDKSRLSVTPERWGDDDDLDRFFGLGTHANWPPALPPQPWGF